jgi:hypothetical protein
MSPGGGAIAVLLVAARLAAQGTDPSRDPRALSEPTSAAGERAEDGKSDQEGDVDGGHHEALRPREDPPPQHPHLGPYELAGAAAIGWRLFDVDGNDAQFDEDRNLERGIFLRDFDLVGTRAPADSGPESFRLTALGLGTRNASLRGRTSYAGMAALARYDRSHYAATTSTDVHSFDFERERGSLSLTREADGVLRRAELELFVGHSDGFRLSSRSFTRGFVPGVPAQQEERQRGAEGKLKFDLGGVGLELELAAEDLDARDGHRFQAAHPIFPQATVSEDFAGDAEGLAYRGGVRLRRALAERALELDAGVSWEALGNNGTFTAHETGIAFNDPSLPFVSDTLGEMDFDGRKLAADAGMTWKLAGAAEADFRYRHEREAEDRHLDQTVSLDELMGDPPTVSTFPDDSRHRSSLDQVEAGLSTPVAERVDLELVLEVGREEIDVLDVSNMTVVRQFDDSVWIYGGEMRCIAETGPASTLEFDGGYGVRPTEGTLIGGVSFTFDDTRTRFEALRWRWRPGEGATLGVEARHEIRHNAGFDSRGAFDSLSASGSARVARAVFLEAALGYRKFNLEADTSVLTLNPTAVPISSQVFFQGSQNLVSVGATWDIDEALRPRLSASAFLGSGDGAFDYEELALDVPYRISGALEVGGELGWLRFDGEETLDARDYEAALLTLYVRASF